MITLKNDPNVSGVEIIEIRDCHDPIHVATAFRVRLHWSQSMHFDSWSVATQLQYQ